MTTTTEPDDLSAEIHCIRQDAEYQIKALEDRAEAVVPELEAALKNLVASRGFCWCEQCNGTGAIERLNSG